MKKAKEVILLLGSNVGQQSIIENAKEQLGSILLPGWTSSQLLMTAPVGIVGPDFANEILTGATDQDYSSFLKATKNIERQMGRCPEDKALGKIIIDIDILLFDGMRYHEKDWGREYVKRLMEK